MGIQINQDDLEIYEIIQNSKIIQNLLQNLNLKDKGSDNLIFLSGNFQSNNSKSNFTFSKLWENSNLNAYDFAEPNKHQYHLSIIKPLN